MWRNDDPQCGQAQSRSDSGAGDGCDGIVAAAGQAVTRGVGGDCEGAECGTFSGSDFGRVLACADDLIDGSHLERRVETTVSVVGFFRHRAQSCVIVSLTPGRARVARRRSMPRKFWTLPRTSGCDRTPLRRSSVRLLRHQSRIARSRSADLVKEADRVRPIGPGWHFGRDMS